MTSTLCSESVVTGNEAVATPADDVFVFPVSFAQQRFWLLDQLMPGNPVYNVGTALRLQGSLDRQALEQSLNEIVRRHESLRTTFGTVDAQPVQIITPTQVLPLPRLDLSGL